MRVLYKEGPYRIVEHDDPDYRFKDLCGDCYNPEVNPGIPEEQLLKEKENFRNRIDREGVFGYVLEKWNPEIGKGWEYHNFHSCWGFVGEYNPAVSDTNHYIVEELKEVINKENVA